MTQVAKNNAMPTGPNVPVSKNSDSHVLDRLVRGRIKLLINAPFFGNMATRLKFIDASKWCPTLATDGRNFYYNKDFVDWLDDGEIEFGVGHEVLHCVYDHMDLDQIGDRDRRLCNISQDYVINSDLVDANIGTKITKVDICFDWKYRGMHWMEVYDQLFEEAEKDGRVQYVDNFDMHLDGEGEEDADGTPAPGEPGNDGTDGPIRYSKEELEQIKNDVQSATIQAAKAAGAGNTPAGIKRLLKDLLEPKLDWRELIAQQIQSVIKSDYTMSRPSRKGMDSGFYLPSMDYDETIDIAIAVDTSGSMHDDMLRDILSEVKGCMEQYTNYKIHLFCFDTEVHNVQVFTENNMGEFMEYEPAGGGGTDFMVCWNYFKEEGIVPKKFIMFTDMYPWDSWGDPDYCDTLFISHGADVEAPFGITVKYERD